MYRSIGTDLLSIHGSERRSVCVDANHDDSQINAIPQLRSGSVPLSWVNQSIDYLAPGIPGGLVPPGGLMLSRGERPKSGFVDILGSRLGGLTEPRGSPRLSGACWIPGSMRDGGIAGTTDSDGFSGVMPGTGPLPLSGDWAGGSMSAATANTGRKRRVAMAISRGAITDHHLIESEGGTPLY